MQTLTYFWNFFLFISRLHAELFHVWWFNQPNRISIELKSLSWLDYFIILNYLLLFLLKICLDNFLKCYTLLSCYMVHTGIRLNFQADSITLSSNTLWYNKVSIVNYMIVLSASIHSQGMTFPHAFFYSCYEVIFLTSCLWFASNIPSVTVRK